MDPSGFPTLAELQRYEYEARRLRASHTHDWTVRMVVGLDLALRRAACRIATALSARVTPCR